MRCTDNVCILPVTNGRRASFYMICRVSKAYFFKKVCFFISNKQINNIFMTIGPFYTLEGFRHVRIQKVLSGGGGGLLVIILLQRGEGSVPIL